MNIQIKAVEIQRSNDRDQIPGLNAGLPETRDRLEITQGGRVVDPSTAKGPIRLRLR